MSARLPRPLLALALVALLAAFVAGLWLASEGGSEDLGDRAGGGEGPSHVLLIVLDTLRADIVEEVPTPRLDELGRRGQAVAHAWAPSTWTAPSMISLFTGTHVRQTGWDFPFPNRMPNRTESYPAIPAEVPVLAEVLEANGFQTAGWWANSLVNRDLGLERGFHKWRGSRDRHMHKRVKRYRDARWEESERHFLYVHMFAGHHPLRPSQQAQELYPMEPGWIVRGRGFSIGRAREAGVPGHEAYAQAYRGVVMDVDKRVGQILDLLGPELDDTLVVITSDHGELLGEHGKLGHERWVWNQLTQVPLVVAGGPELPDPFPVAGLADYITDTVGISHPWPVQWEDPGPLVAQREGKLALSEDGDLKAIWDPMAYGDHAHVFDLTVDPLEEKPLGALTPEFEAKREAWEAAVPDVTLAPREGAMDAATLSALEALGYMDGDETWDGDDELEVEGDGGAPEKDSGKD